MIIKAAKEITHRWVLEEASNQVGFQGAFYHGSTQLAARRCDPTRNVRFGHYDCLCRSASCQVRQVYLSRCNAGGFLLAWPADQLQSPEQILGNYVIAGSFQGPSIIEDPSGQLTKLQAVVSAEYAKRQWVYKRCEDQGKNPKIGCNNWTGWFPYIIR